MSKATNNPDVCTEHFNRVYDETFTEIKAYVAAQCADESYVPDILQEIYYEYFKLILKNGVEYAKNPRAVIHKIAKRRIFHYYSLKQKLATCVPLFSVNGNDEEYCVADAICEDGEDESILDDIEAERIWNIIRTYPPDVRKIMYLYFNCGMSHSQIAQRLGCNLSNVKNKLYRTLAEIREKENGNERKKD